MTCSLCKERETEIKRILAGYKKDKTWYRKVIKILSISLGIILFELILTLTYGKEGISIGFNLAKWIINKIF